MPYSRTYNELQHLQTFDERFEYLTLRGRVGSITFGHERFLNQSFYTSKEWRNIRQAVIVRDEGRDLGLIGHEIYDRPIVHHINPLTIEDIESGSPALFDLNNLITTSHDTHNAIHYGDRKRLQPQYVERQPGDTTLWGRRV